MAAVLDQELQDRGVFCLGRADCEAIIAAVLERTAEAGDAITIKAKAKRGK